jgi:hypothetical protein
MYRNVCREQELDHAHHPISLFPSIVMAQAGHKGEIDIPEAAECGGTGMRKPWLGGLEEESRQMLLSQ